MNNHVPVLQKVVFLVSLLIFWPVQCRRRLDGHRKVDDHWQFGRLLHHVLSNDYHHFPKWRHCGIPQHVE